MDLYKVKQKDLKGNIKGFPIEVVQKMIERQAEQGTLPSIAVFQKKADANFRENGFDWDKTIEGNSFWCITIHFHIFYRFFSKYPKKTKTKKVLQKPVLGNKRIKMLKDEIKYCLNNNKTIPSDYTKEYNSLIETKMSDLNDEREI